MIKVDINSGSAHKKRKLCEEVPPLPTATLIPSEESDIYVDTSNSEERVDGEEKTEKKKEKKEKRKIRKREYISPDTSPVIAEARHESLPQAVPVL